MESIWECFPANDGKHETFASWVDWEAGLKELVLQLVPPRSVHWGKRLNSISGEKGVIGPNNIRHVDQSYPSRANSLDQLIGLILISLY